MDYFNLQTVLKELYDEELLSIEGGSMNVWWLIGYLAQSLAIGAENCGEYGQHVYFKDSKYRQMWEKQVLKQI
jgi:hypothetical protein